MSITTKQSPRRRFAAAAMMAATGAAIAAGALGAASPAGAEPNDLTPRQSTFVAISYSPATGNWGWGNQYNNLNDAVNRSLTECSNAGGTNCQFVAWAQDACAALAVNGGSYYGFWGQNQYLAEQAALAKNGGGHIEISRCSSY